MYFTFRGGVGGGGGGGFPFCHVEKSGFNKGLMPPWFLQSLALSQCHSGVSLGVSPSGPVPSKKRALRRACCGLLQMPLPPGD